MSNEQHGRTGDLALMVVPLRGRLVETGDRGEPYRIVDGSAEVVAPVVTYFRELQAGGRSASTLRSYGMDLLRWFRFLSALRGWDRATRVEARDFGRWLQLAGKPARPHWRMVSDRMRRRVVGAGVRGVGAGA